MVDTDKATLSSDDKFGLPAYVDTETVFRLVDSILPFEACLYHQVIPLSLEGSRLKLGIVNLDDTAALDYVRRILAYMNCSLVPQTISLDVHHAILSAYLSHSGNKKASQAHNKPRHTPATDSSPNSADPPKATGTRPVSSDRHTAPTLLVDSPEELLREEEATSANRRNTDTLADNFAEAPPAIDQEASLPAPLAIDVDDDTPTQPLSVSDSPLYSAKIGGFNPNLTAPPPVNLARPNSALPALKIQASHLNESLETLTALPAGQILQELLGRVLTGGIGRLYFQRLPDRGRILWSQNGIPQSILENLSLEKLQAVINELKALTHMPQVAVQKPKQVEIERQYQRQRLLLRLRLMPGKHGEEATLQVLRGAALKFYQQQQLTNLSRDALTIAQELQAKVDELQARTHSYPTLSPEQLKLLPALNEVIKNVEHQLELLRAIQIDANNKHSSG